MKKSSLYGMLVFAMSLLLCGTVSLLGQAQVTGAIQGQVTDASGAVLPSASVTLVNTGTGAQQSGKPDNRGEIRFSLLPPGQYSLVVAAQGFATQTLKLTVLVGQITPANVKMGVASATQTVEVNSATAPLIETQTAVTSSTLDEKQVQSLPIPGRDINYLALLSPGAEMVGGGSFPSVQGLPTTSNLYTVNGMEDIDPWNNSTNGGASNLLLGMNEVQESTEVSDGFNGSYGTLAGSNVNMVTKSGTNNFHGNLVWDWAGRATESNDFFFNKDGESRPFVNANQWAGSIGGPIFHNKLFFFVDNEGIALVLPGSATPVLVPTAAFETATIANLNATGQSAQVPFYNKMFSLWNNAPGASTAAPLAGSCGTLAIAGVANCANQFYSAQTNTSHEIVTTFRIDYNISAKDHAYFHYLLDKGVQDTGVDPINPAFDAISHQPEFNGQFSETHVFGANAVNNFQAAAQNYKALFGPSDIGAAIAVFPTELDLGDGSFTSLGGADASYPAGRNVTRYQFSDDYSHLWGNHSFQTGAIFSRYDATDLQFGSGTNGDLVPQTLTAFYNGGYAPASSGTDYTTYSQTYPLALEQPLAMYRLGVYAQDEWHITNNLTINGALRLDHFSNPICVTNCFADTTGFLTMAHGASIPYNQSITTGLATGIPSLQTVMWQPRAGFNWQPWGATGKTAIRGGFGLFTNGFPLDTITGFATNPPEDPSFKAIGNSSTGYVLAPGLSNSLNTATAASNSALQTGFSKGDTLAQLEAAAPGFTIPNLTSSDSHVINPTYYKWNLDVQRELWKNAAIDIAYNGNHGVHELIENTNVNAYDPNGFTGLPTAPVDPRFLQVNNYQSDGISNYNGMTASFTQRYTSGMVRVNYTWAHALDDEVGTGTTTTTQYTTDSRAYYGPSDFDYRHYVSADWVWDAPFAKWFGGSNWVKSIDRNWEADGNLIARTGGPMYVYTTKNSGISAFGYGGRTLANYTGGIVPGSCQTPDAACFNPGNFGATFNSVTGKWTIPNITGFSTTQSRDMFRGPGFWDVNLSVSRHFAVPHMEGKQFAISANAFNLFNHPNFGNPTTSLTSPLFGTINSMVDPSSSPLGSNGADTSVRIIQTQLSFIF